MKWIKYTDRKPENWDGVIIRNWVGTKIIVSEFMVTLNGIKIPPQYDFTWRWDDIEWLDESTLDRPDDYLVRLIKQASPTWKGVDVEKYLDEVRGGVESLTPEMIDQIAEEIEAQHPYKVPGRHETFDRYNEGWADACSVLADRIKEALNK